MRDVLRDLYPPRHPCDAGGSNCLIVVHVSSHSPKDRISTGCSSCRRFSVCCEYPGLKRDLESLKCVGHAIVQADNAPDCGVAQGVIHGVPVRHGEKQEEEEGEVEKEVERDKEEDNNQTPVRMSMDGME